MIKVKPLVKFEILLQAHGLHSTGQQADHCLDLVHNNLYLVQLVHAKLPEIAKICSVLEFYERNTGPAPHVNCKNFCQENISKLT